jgi:RNA polymerase sigma-70 factor (ECF subfamily)
MDDRLILDLYFARSEDAIRHTKDKYGRLLFGISYNIVKSDGDAEECVSDTYMSAWKSIPPARPNHLSAFLSKIVRNLSLNRYRKNRARARLMSNEAIFEEIEACVPDGGDIAGDLEIRDALNAFLSGQAKNARMIFVKRYFYMMSVKEISLDMRITVSNVKVILMRTREKMKTHLEKAGISI